MLFYTSSVTGEIEISTAYVIVVAAVVAVFYLALYFLRSFGLYKLGKNAGLNNLFVAFIPILWIILCGKLIGATQFFSKKIKNIGVIVFIFVLINFILSTFYSLCQYIPLIMGYLRGGTIVLSGEDLSSSYQLFGQLLGTYVYIEGFTVAYSQPFMGLLNAVYYVSAITSFADFIFMLFLFTALFKKYAPAHYMRYTVICALLGFEGIFIFAIRNKQPVKYKDFIRARYEAFYGRNPNARYGAGGSQQMPPDNPFSDFADKGDYDPGDPFGEFSDKNGGNNDGNGDNGNNSNGGNGGEN